jgi:hypothetical protein
MNINIHRCEWLTDQRSTHDDCLTLLFMGTVGTAVAVMYDISSLGASVAAMELLKGYHIYICIHIDLYTHLYIHLFVYTCIYGCSCNI